MFYVVCYDTPSNNRRRRLANYLLNYLGRVQKSVFEGYLGRKEYREMMEKMDDYIDVENDSVRIYEILEASVESVTVYGRPSLTQDVDHYIVG